MLSRWHACFVVQGNLAGMADAGCDALQYLSEETASKAEQRAVALRQAMLDFQRFDGDTGSSEVQGGQRGPMLPTRSACYLHDAGHSTFACNVNPHRHAPCSLSV